jgi:formylglycine-generating enzyme
MTESHAKRYWFAAFLLLGCRTSTQVTVELSTDVPCGELAGTTAQVGRLGPNLEARAPSVATTSCSASGRIGSFVVVPSGDRKDEFGVKVVLAHGGPSITDCTVAEQNSTKLSGCISARRALRFIPHEELMLPIELREDCDSVLCEPTATCVHGTCVPATIPDNGLCRGAGCPDSTLLPPGATFDAGPDGPLDASTATDACADGSCLSVASCKGLPADCGTPPTDSCCASPLVPAGTFKRHNAVPTTVSSFRLDKYEVTIGRFRAFVDAVVAGYRPAAGSGKHIHLPNGGLVDHYDMDMLEHGWDPAWNSNLPSDKTTWDDVDHLSCVGSVWTANPRADEKKPVTCVNWYQAYAFCIWDGGFLPSYNEFNYAWMAGDLERPRPWGAEPVAPERAIYCAVGDCKAALPSDVGSRPLGDGYFGQSDLAGSASEWVLDGFNGLDVCKDCIFFGGPPVVVANVGGAYNSAPAELELDYQWTEKVEKGVGNLGFRCARPP